MMNIEKEKIAIDRIKSFEPDDGYYVCYSGGKDSDVIRILSVLSGVKHELHNNHTTVDAPETVRYIRSIPNIIIDYPKYSMWQLIVKKGMPLTRLMRYCCSELKERNGVGRLRITGVRWSESVARSKNNDLINIIGKPKDTLSRAEEIGLDYTLNKKGGVILSTDNSESRRMVEMCYRTRSTTLNPIVDWSDKDVWDFLHHYGCRSNPLYECGFCRIGCIGCVMSGKMRYTEFSRYPKYKENYIKAFDRMLLRRDEKVYDRKSWVNGEAVFKWWMEEDLNQIKFEDLLN